MVPWRAVDALRGLVERLLVVPLRRVDLLRRPAAAVHRDPEAPSLLRLLLAEGRVTEGHRVLADRDGAVGVQRG